MGNFGYIAPDEFNSLENIRIGDDQIQLTQSEVGYQESVDQEISQPLMPKNLMVFL